MTFGDVGVGGSGTGVLAIAPGKVADFGEEPADVGELCSEEDDGVYEGAFADYDFLSDGASYFFAWIEEVDVG